MERNLIQIQYMTIEVRETISKGKPEKSRYIKGFRISHQEKDTNPSRSEKTKVMRKRLLAKLPDRC